MRPERNRSLAAWEPAVSTPGLDVNIINIALALSQQKRAANMQTSKAINATSNQKRFTLGKHNLDYQFPGMGEPIEFSERVRGTRPVMRAIKNLST